MLLNKLICIEICLKLNPHPILSIIFGDSIKNKIQKKKETELMFERQKVKNKIKKCYDDKVTNGKGQIKKNLVLMRKEEWLRFSMLF